MSNRNPEVAKEHIGRTVRFIVEALLKEIHTAIPGLIETYDRRRRIARVQPALDLVMTDGAVHPRALVVNVPVLWLAPSGYAIHGPLVRGEPVMLLCSERDIARFKASRRRAIPEDPRCFSLIDAVAIAGFGPAGEIEAAGADDALVVQSSDGATYVEMRPGSLNMTPDGGTTLLSMAAGRTRIASAAIELAGTTLTHNGANIGSTHVHGGIASGPGRTGGPE